VRGVPDGHRAVIAEAYNAFLFDLDGVLYRGDRPIAHADATVARLRALGKGIAFVTNNSSRTPDDVAAHLGSVGIDARPDEVETSALTAAAELPGRGVRTAFVIGEQGLRTALADAGIEVVPADAAADAVVVGWDRSFTYDALRAASVAVQRGAAVFATNADASYPAPDGGTWPGAGSLVAAVETATGVRATVFGKPNPPIFEAARRRAGGGRALVIGDRIDTDIEGARRVRWDSALVLTGISTRDDLATSGIAATYVLDDLSVLLRP
jgi:HAD superfamily hydrolase (TIGR01457 family)